MSDENNALSGEQDAIAESEMEQATPTDDESVAQADAEADDAEQDEDSGDEAKDAKAKAEDDESAEDDKPKRNKKSASERISQLTQIRRDQEREIERLRQQLDRVSKLERPDQNRYDDPDEYTSDLAAYKLRTLQADDLRESAKAAQQSAQQALQAAYNERLMDFASETPDFHTVAMNPALQITPVMAEQIMDSDLGPQVQYYLGRNPREAARIAALPPAQQIREIGRLEARVSAPAPKRTTQAPAPIRPVAGNSKPRLSYSDDMSMEDYAKLRAAGRNP